MSASIIYLGLDVHKDSIVSAVLPARPQPQDQCKAAAPAQLARPRQQQARVRRRLVTPHPGCQILPNANIPAATRCGVG